MALYGAVQGSRPGLKEHSIAQATVNPNEDTLVVEFGNFLQTVEDVQISWVTPQLASAAFANLTSITNGTTVTINVQTNVFAAATTVATLDVSAIGEALR